MTHVKKLYKVAEISKKVAEISERMAESSESSEFSIISEISAYP